VKTCDTHARPGLQFSAAGALSFYKMKTVCVIIGTIMQIVQAVKAGLQKAISRKLLLGILLPAFFVGIAVFAPGHLVHAQDSGFTSYFPTAESVPAQFIVLIARILNTIVGAIGSLTLVVIEMLVVPILNYNSFSSSIIIGLGWSLVRDVVNMFVIIILLAIAIRTILGVHGSHWQQQIPQLFIAVIMVNFSRTICGLAIDVSQVIMFTFVNALLDIAAGNFAQLLGLTSFGKLDPETTQKLANAGKSVTDAGHLLAAAFLQIPLYGSILAIMFLLAAAFLWRIVILWILVILSPLAFFLQGIQGIVPVGGAGDWMGKFTAALVMGPLLTFFLWLSLAAASSGPIGETEGFSFPRDAETGGLSLEVFDSSHLTSLVLALILLVVGMQQAGQYSSKLDGLAKSAINEDMGRRTVSFFAKSPFSASAAAGRRLDRYGADFADKRLGNKGSFSVRESLAKSGYKVGGAVATKAGPLGYVAGRGIMAGAGVLENQAEHLVEGDLKIAKDRVKNMANDQKIAEYALIGAGQASWKMGNKDDSAALAMDLVTNPKMQSKVFDHMKEHAEHDGMNETDAKAHAQDEYDKLMREALTITEKNKEMLFHGDDAGKQKLNDAKSKHLHLLGSQDDIKKFVASNEFNASKVSNAALASADVRDALASESDKNVKEDISYLDRFEQKKYTGRLPANYKSTASTRTYASLAGGNTAVAGYASAFKDGKIGVSNVSTDDLNDPAKGKAIVAGMFVAGKGADVKGASPEVQAAVRQNVMSSQPSSVVSEAINSGAVEIDDFDAPVFDTSTPRGGEVVKGVINSEADVSKIKNTAAQDAFAQAIPDMQAKGQIDTPTAARGYAKVLATGKKIEDVVPGAVIDPDPAKLTFANRDAEVAEILNTNVANARYLRRAVPSYRSGARNIGNKATAFVAQSASKDNITDLVNRYRSLPKNSPQRQEISQAFETIADSVRIEAQNQPPVVPGVEPTKAQKKLANLANHVTVMSRFI
jgi:hypothetical protein